MGWRFVKQPNGLLGIFSEVVDDFIGYNYTEAEAIDYCRSERGMPARHAARKVASGVHDEPTPWPDPEARGDGLDRWRSALRTIRAIHGLDAAEERERMIDEETA